MKDAGIASPADVHFVQIKCPLLTKERIEEARSARRDRRRPTTPIIRWPCRAAPRRWASPWRWARSRTRPKQAICRDWSLYSSVASTSAGVELLRNEIVVLGNAGGWAGDLVIGHDVMKDAIDAEAARRVLAAHRRRRPSPCSPRPRPSPSGEIRGRRHTMLDDSDIHSTRHARALVGGVLAGVIGDTMLYVSGGAEHQGPAGGGPSRSLGGCDRLG